MGFKSTKEIAEFFSVGESTIRRMIYSGKIKAAKFGKKWKVTQEEFERLKKEMESVIEK